MQRSIFITGAASGIGRAATELFVARDWLVGMVDFDDEGLRRVAEAIGPHRADEERRVPQAGEMRRKVQRRAAQPGRIREVIPQDLPDDQHARGNRVCERLWL